MTGNHCWGRDSPALNAAPFSWAAFGGRFLVPSSLVLTSLRGLDGVCSVARKLATAQTLSVAALAGALAVTGSAMMAT